ncbi:MAG: SRPBCC domain-containing protein [Deinococcota bacterium]
MTTATTTSANMQDAQDARDAIVIERLFDAPIDRIWQLWTDAEHFKQWYGPQGFSVPVAKLDTHAGGTRHVCMQRGEMTFWTVGEVLESTPPTHLVYTESMADDQGNIISKGNAPVATQVTVILEDMNGRTKMTMTHAGVGQGAKGGSQGWQQAFDKLEVYLNQTS